MDPAERYVVTVCGAGSWGSALAILLARNGHHCCLWGNEPAVVDKLQTERQNRLCLAGIPFPDSLDISSQLQEAVAASDNLLIAVPSHVFRTHLQALKPLLEDKMRVAWATKGLELETAMLPHQVAQSVLGESRPLAVISGPTFAREVASGLPTAITVASKNPEFSEKLSGLLHGEQFRAYTSSDMVGVELGGAVKNVLAIAAGICDGLGFGANSRAALVTRGLAELMRLGEAMGGRRETFMGLAGVGDLVLTCTDDQSRNRRLGLALGQGINYQQALQEIGQVVEGVNTAREVVRLAKRFSIDMPITEQVYRVLHENLAPRDAVRALLTREPKQEAF